MRSRSSTGTDLRRSDHPTKRRALKALATDRKPDRPRATKHAGRGKAIDVQSRTGRRCNGMGWAAETAPSPPSTAKAIAAMEGRRSGQGGVRRQRDATHGGRRSTTLTAGPETLRGAVPKRGQHSRYRPRLCGRPGADSQDQMTPARAVMVARVRQRHQGKHHPAEHQIESKPGGYRLHRCPEIRDPFVRINLPFATILVAGETIERAPQIVK